MVTSRYKRGTGTRTIDYDQEESSRLGERFCRSLQAPEKETAKGVGSPKFVPTVLPDDVGIEFFADRVERPGEQMPSNAVINISSICSIKPENTGRAVAGPVSGGFLAVLEFEGTMDGEA